MSTCKAYSTTLASKCQYYGLYLFIWTHAQKYPIILGKISSQEKKKMDGRIETDKVLQQYVAEELQTKYGMKGGDAILTLCIKLEAEAAERYFEFPRGLRAEILAKAIFYGAGRFVVRDHGNETGISGSIVYYRCQPAWRKMLNWLVAPSHITYTSYLSSFSLFRD